MSANALTRGSMQPKHAVDGAQFSGLDQLGMRDPDRIKRPLEFLLPEGKEVPQRREFRKQIVILPDVCLQQRGMIRHPVEDFRRRQPVTQHLFPEVLGNANPRDHANPPTFESAFAAEMAGTLRRATLSRDALT